MRRVKVIRMRFRVRRPHRRKARGEITESAHRDQLVKLIDDRCDKKHAKPAGRRTVKDKLGGSGSKSGVASVNPTEANM